MAGERTAAISLHRDALDDAERFVVALAGRIADESERQRVLSDRLIEVDRQERAFDQEERRLNQVVLELSRLTAKLRWDAALEESKRLEGERDAARALLAAWQAIDVVVAYRTAREAAQTIRVLVQQQEEEAAPLLRARDAAARRFVRGLLDVAAAAEREAAEYDARASGLDTDIEAAEGNQREAIGEAAAVTARIGQATENITGVQNAIRAAVATGLLAEGADVAEAASTAAESADTADAAAAQALERITELAGDRAEADADLDSARTNREAKKRVADDLGGQLSTGQAFADGLRAESRLWQREYPPGRLTRLAEDHQRADEELRASLELEQRCQGILNELVAQQGQLTQQLPRLNKLAKEAHEKATGLRALAAEHAKVAGWQETIRTSRGEHGKAEQEADRNRDLARRLRGQQAEARQAAGDQRRTASHRRGEIGDVVGGGSVGEDESVATSRKIVPWSPTESRRTSRTARP